MSQRKGFRCKADSRKYICSTPLLGLFSNDTLLAENERLLAVTADELDSVHGKRGKVKVEEDKTKVMIFEKTREQPIDFADIES